MDGRTYSLVPVHPDHASTVAGWPRSSVEIEAWCGLVADEVTEAQVLAWSQAADVQAFAFVDGTAPAGYGELWIDDEAGEVELAHLIVRPTMRNRSIGQQMVRALVDVARQRHRLVVLRVRQENQAAIRCYQRAGLYPATAAEEAAWNEGQPHHYRWMVAAD